jgi:mxaL protein
MTWFNLLRRHGEAVLLLLAALALGVTFARPGIGVMQPQVDAVVVLDITQSMNVAEAARRGEPLSRLVHAKHELEQVLTMLPCGSRLGWGVFTEHRSFLLLAPIETCAHQRELLQTLHHIDGRMAWAGNSEVAKGLNSALRMATALDDKPALVFVTDGHEAPPLDPHLRPAFSVARGEVRGLLVGVGGDVPQPIPRSDPSGRQLGWWSAKEVFQVDPRSLGRYGNGEAMADSVSDAVPPNVGATPGAEHLSSLREGYLKLLGSETGLRYQRLGSTEALLAALTDPQLARPVASRVDLRPMLAGLALLALSLPVLVRACKWLLLHGDNS